MLTTEPPDTGRSCHKSATARGMLRRRCKHIALKLKKDPAALVAKMKIKSILPPESGPQSVQNHRIPPENDSPDPAPDPPGGAKDKI